MTKFLEIAASSDEVNIVVFDGRLWAACKKCRDRGITTSSSREKKTFGTASDAAVKFSGRRDVEHQH